MQNRKDIFVKLCKKLRVTLCLNSTLKFMRKNVI